MEVVGSARDGENRGYKKTTLPCGGVALMREPYCGITTYHEPIYFYFVTLTCKITLNLKPYELKPFLKVIKLFCGSLSKFRIVVFTLCIVS